MTVAYEKNPDGSISLDVSAEIVRAMELGDSGTVKMDLQNGQLVIHADVKPPVRRMRRYKMSELLEGYELMPKNEEEDRIWLNSPPVGRELL